MNKLLFPFCLIIFSNIAIAQDASELQDSARNSMRIGDYSKATHFLEKALLTSPADLQISKDLAVTYMVDKKNNKALNVLLPLIEKNTADDQVYQLVGNLYNMLDQRKESEAIYKRGIRKFPESGALYNQYGVMLLSAQDLNAIKIWEKGIEADPQFAGNYFNASRFYSMNSNYIWSSIYGETFLLLEASTERSPEIKNIVLDSYKKLLTDADYLSNLKGKNGFEKAYIQTFLKEKGALTTPINAESLSMIRTRFLLDWNSSYLKKYPFSLFDIQTQLLEEGIFEAYNQWLFGTVQNLAAFQNWISIHNDEYTSFVNFQKGRVFKFRKGEYYHQNK